jgi:hypothetical protein
MNQILEDHKSLINITPEEQKPSLVASEVSEDLEDQDPSEEESPSTSH